MSHNGNSKVYDQLYDDCLNMTVGEFQDWLDKNVSNKKIKNSNHLGEVDDLLILVILKKIIPN